MKEPVFTHARGDTHELSPGRNNITNLVEKWDRLQSFEVDSDRVVEGEKGEGRVYSARRVSQEFLRLQNIFEHRSQEVQPTDVHSISSLNVSFNNIPTNSKGAATNVSRIPRRIKVYRNAHLLDIWKVRVKWTDILVYLHYLLRKGSTDRRYWPS